MYDIKSYYEATTTAEAISLLMSHPDAKIICGGSDLLIKIRAGKFAGCELISIRNISELQGISPLANKDISIGAATTFNHISNDPLIRTHLPVLGEAVNLVGGPQVRNIGTIGGNICNGAVSADSVPAAFSLMAKLYLTGPAGVRVVDIADFYKGPGQVNLQPGELLTHIVVPAAHYQGYTGHYIKYSMRKAMDIAALSCCVVCRLTPDKKILENVRITFGVAAPTPLRCIHTEESLKGLAVNDKLYPLMEAFIREEINPRDSWRASKKFRLQIGGEIAKRALKEALKRQEVSAS